MVKNPFSLTQFFSLLRKCTWCHFFLKWDLCVCLFLLIAGWNPISPAIGFLPMTDKVECVSINACYNLSDTCNHVSQYAHTTLYIHLHRSCLTFKSWRNTFRNRHFCIRSRMNDFRFGFVCLCVCVFSAIYQVFQKKKTKDLMGWLLSSVCVSKKQTSKKQKQNWNPLICVYCSD